MEKRIVIREYEPADKNAVMDLIRLNIPMYFAVEEEAAFDMYLDRERELYYVLLVDELIVGCGGINFADNMTHGKISWDIFHPDYQRKSLGSRLLRYRIEKLKTVESIRKMTVRTSQFVYGFYEKHGFELKEVVKNYWAQGFDLYYMEYKEKRQENGI